MGMQRATQPATRPRLDAETDVVEHGEASERIAGGPVPAVHNGGDAGHGGRSASELAYEVAANDDENVTELQTKVGALVEKQFGGDYKKAFEAYDGDHDGGVNGDELSQLLKDAKVGTFVTRGMWVKGILDKLDKTGDRKIQWPEFESVFGASA